jgi:tRNA-Thr(GGU) m(6)t(6)A37 methyltransferase TsaA
MQKITYTPIGIVHSPFIAPSGTPIQPAAAKDVTATIEIFRAYRDGLKDLDGFSHLFLLCHMHLAKQGAMQVIPFLDKQFRGIFATRSPGRPNAIGLSIVRLERIEDGILTVRDIDLLDKTPVLDIKPYIPVFDSVADARSGWFEAHKDELDGCQDNGRFALA